MTMADGGSGGGDVAGGYKQTNDRRDDKNNLKPTKQFNIRIA